MAYLLSAVSVFAVLLPAAPVAAQPPDEYYITVFGSGSHSLAARRTHTFATLTHVRHTPAGTEVRNDTISWLPATLHIRPLALRPEPGANLTLAESLHWAAGLGLRTSAWGPFAIPPERYAAFLARKSELDSGHIAYRAIGGLTKDAPVSNCGQSFSRAARLGQRAIQPTPFPGEPVTRVLVLRMIRNATDPVIEHPGLLPVVVDPAAVTHRAPGERIPRFSP